VHQLISTLETAMQDSINADKDYQYWLMDLANSGNPCGSDPGQDSNYVAPRYGQQTYSSTDF
jgi:hypothetical protein